MQDLPGRRQPDHTAGPREQLHAQLILELAHEVAHRGRRHAELGRGLGEARMARRRLEAAQPAQSGDDGRHDLIFK
jgi:hypothetical protein